jgi:hypothetical protein
MPMDEYMEKTKKSEKDAQNYSDAMTSANEKFTTDEGEESDIEEEKLAKADLEGRPLGKEIPDIERKSQEEEESTTQKLMNAITGILSNEILRILDKEMLEFAREFEQEFSQSVDKERFLYGLQQDKNSIEAAEFLKQNPIKTIIPESVLNTVQDFSIPKLEFKSVNPYSLNVITSSLISKMLKLSQVMITLS